MYVCPQPYKNELKARVQVRPSSDSFGFPFNSIKHCKPHLIPLFCSNSYIYVYMYIYIYKL